MHSEATPARTQSRTAQTQRRAIRPGQSRYCRSHLKRRFRQPNGCTPSKSGFRSGLVAGDGRWLPASGVLDVAQPFGRRIRERRAGADQSGQRPAPGLLQRRPQPVFGEALSYIARGRSPPAGPRRSDLALDLSPVRQPVLRVPDRRAHARLGRRVQRADRGMRKSDAEPRTYWGHERANPQGGQSRACPERASPFFKSCPSRCRSPRLQPSTGSPAGICTASWAATGEEAFRRSSRTRDARGRRRSRRLRRFARG
jgi:hypothetical protein